MDVCIAGTGRIRIEKKTALSLREMAAKALVLSLQDARLDHVDAVYSSNLLADEHQNQKHTAALFADAAGLFGVEALEVRAATASGAAALRLAYLAVSSGQIESAAVVGAEKMSDGSSQDNLAKSLDAEREVPRGLSMIRANAEIMKRYMDLYNINYECFLNFSLNSHRNSVSNSFALFQQTVSENEMLASRIIADPIRLFDCAPVCDGAAAVILTKSSRSSSSSVKIKASSAATDRFAIEDRKNPLELQAARLSSQKAYRQAEIKPEDIDFFELHDAFSIMSCLSLEACGFAEPGQGWKLAQEKEIFREGRIPVATMGGLKARGHPVGATSLYQICEMSMQLRNQAGENQVPGAGIGMTQSIGGAGTTVITHILVV